MAQVDAEKAAGVDISQYGCSKVVTQIMDDPALTGEATEEKQSAK